MAKENNIKDGNIFKVLRDYKKWTVKELGEKLDIAESYIYLIENNKKYPSITLLKKYCEVFGISFQTFLLLEDDSEKGEWTYRQLMFKIMETLDKKDN